MLDHDLPFLRDAVPNLRDVGGARTARGDMVRPRRLFRSAALVGLPDRDLDLLTEVLGPVVYFDLRSDREVERDGGAEGLSARGWRWLRLPVEDEDDSLSSPLDRYLRAIPQYLAAAQNILRCLPPDGRGLVACSLGKDRTGLVVALILRWLDVVDRDIAADFVLSNRCLDCQRHLLLPRWRHPGHSFNIVNAEDCLRAIATADLSSIPSEWRRDWVERAT